MNSIDWIMDANIRKVGCEGKKEKGSKGTTLDLFGKVEKVGKWMGNACLNLEFCAPCFSSTFVEFPSIYYYYSIYMKSILKKKNEERSRKEYRKREVRIGN